MASIDTGFETWALCVCGYRQKRGGLRPLARRQEPLTRGATLLPRDAPTVSPSHLVWAVISLCKSGTFFQGREVTLGANSPMARSVRPSAVRHPVGSCTAWPDTGPSAIWQGSIHGQPVPVRGRSPRRGWPVTARSHARDEGTGPQAVTLFRIPIPAIP